MQTKSVLNHDWFLTQTKLVEQGINGIRFPFDSINAILLTNADKEKMVVEENKKSVFDFIIKNKRVYLSEIANNFDLSIIETKLILKELEKEGKIVLNK